MEGVKSRVRAVFKIAAVLVLAPVVFIAGVFYLALAFLKGLLYIVTSLASELLGSKHTRRPSSDK